jgi:hypothetical protein
MMDSLKSLLDKKQYDLILSLTSGANDPEALVYRTSAFLAKGDAKSAMAILIDNRALLYKANPVLTLKSNFELRFILHQFDEAYEDLKYFQDQPYVSQEVEEYLQSLPNIIRTNERNQQLAKNYTPEDIERIFKSSTDDYEVLSLLNYLEGAHISDYILYLKDILVSNRHPQVKTYALLLLISQNYPMEVTFSKNGSTYHLIPKKLTPPYTGDTFNAFMLYLRDQCADPSVANIAISLCNDYILDIYPEEVISKAEDPLLATALIKLAREYLHSSLGIQGYLDKYQLNKQEVEALATRIKSMLDSVPPLKI